MEINSSNNQYPSGIESGSTNVNSTPNYKALVALTSILFIALVGVSAYAYMLSLKINDSVVPINTNTELEKEVKKEKVEVSEGIIVDDEEKWVRKMYSSDGQVQWNIMHPSNISNLNTEGLLEGFLSFDAKWKESLYKLTFNYPIFEGGFPNNIDSWAKDYYQGSSYYNTKNQKVLVADKDGVKIRIITGIQGYLDGGKNNSTFPATTILIWEHDSISKKMHINQSVINIEQRMGGVDYTREFAEKIVEGLVL